MSDRPRPTTLILGWAGSRARQLRPTATLYRRLGTDPRTFVPDVMAGMGRDDGWIEQGREVAAQAVAATQRGSRVLFHVYSNAGFWTYTATLAALAEGAEGRACLQRSVGAVLDSAPGFSEDVDASFTGHYASMALMPMLRRRLGKPEALTDPVLTPIVSRLLWLWHHLARGQVERMRSSLQDVASAIGPSDYVLFYGTADELVLPHYVEAFAERLSAHGHRVTQHRFDTSHVVHMLKHRARYTALLAEWLAERVAGT